MSMTLLDSDDIAQVVLTVATPNALRNILRTHIIVKAVRRHLLESMDPRREIEEFVRKRLIDLTPPIYFSHEPAFCALAVALETLSLPVAESLLSELAPLRIAEMPLSPRVAELCMQHRQKILISDTRKVFEVNPMPLPDGPSVMRTNKVPTNSTFIPDLKAA